MQIEHLKLLKIFIINFKVVYEHFSIFMYDQSMILVRDNSQFLID